MRIGVVDVGSNTIRLLLAQVEGRDIVPLAKERVRLALGAEIEQRGAVSDVSIAAAAKAVRKLCTVARNGGAETLDVFLTAPGRQSGNADDLVDALTRAAGHSVRVLSTEEEGRLAYAGAVATADVTLPRSIAVCDVGGASTEIAVGSPGASPEWIRSVDLGSVRLTARVEDPAEAAAEAARAFASVDPPRVQAALAVGGSARAARRLVGSWLGAEELAAGAQSRRDAVAAGDLAALRRPPDARADPPRRPRCSSPRCRAGSAFRCTCATAASARARCSPSPPSSPA